MATNATSAPDTGQPDTIQSVLTVVQVNSPTGETYNNSFSTIPQAFCESVTHQLGPEPGTATFFIAAAADGTVPNNIYDHVVWDRRQPGSEIAPVGPRDGQADPIRLYSKVRISAIFNNAGTFTLHTLFVGYITEYDLIYEGQRTSVYRVTCKDARELLRKTPVQGILFLNPDLTKINTGADPFPPTDIVYIRDAEIPFNEGGLPNRAHIPDDWNRSHGVPMFCRTDLNRFDSDGFYVDDSFQSPGTLKDRLYADRWYVGDAWNYLRNLIDESLMRGSDRLYTDPSAELPLDSLPPLRDTEIDIARVDDKGTSLDYYRELFTPRNIIGATDAGIGVGAVNYVSALGEWNPVGLPVNEALFDILRRVGNFTIYAEYDDTKLNIRPMRTSNALGSENQQTGGPAGASSVSKKVVVRATSDNAVDAPSTVSGSVKTKTEAYANTFHMKAGDRWVQLTFTTVGRALAVDKLDQTHEAYKHVAAGGGVPDGEWLPKLTTPTLAPAWNKDTQTEWLKLSTAKINFTAYPDVYRTWVVPDDLDWVALWGLPAKEGYRRYFDRDRQAMNELLISYWDLTLDIFRSRRVKFPLTLWRAFRGIRTTTGGVTPYGDIENTALKGLQDWFPVQSSWQIVTDGRFGFMLDEDARFNSLFQLEVPEGETRKGPPVTPMSWNGLANIADPDDLTSYNPGTDMRTYEFMLTVPVKVDEQMWNYLNIAGAGAALPINKFGPRMEMYRPGLNQYGEERASHSVFSIGNISHRENPILSVTSAVTPPVDANGFDDAKEIVFRDDNPEVATRTQMMANRHAKPDHEMVFVIPYVDLSVKAGMRVSDILFEGLDPVYVNAIVASVNFDLVLQRTTVNVATVR